MSSILNHMTQGHGLCDQLFAVAEQSVAERNWTDAQGAFTDFITTLERHFRMEERVLFPVVERYSGHSGGPTEMMRMEHQQMRGLLENMLDALGRQQQDEFLGSAETLLILMQQHNMKEEQILYPMSDQLIGKDAESVITAMDLLD